MSRVNTRRPQREVNRKQRLEGVRSVGIRMGVMIMFVGACVAALIWLNDSFRVRHWEVQAEDDLKDRIQEVFRSGDIDLTQYGFLQLSPSHIQALLMEKVPDIESVDVRRQLPDRIFINARSKQAIALWQKAAESIYLVDTHGHPYRTIRSNEVPDLPLLRVRQNQLPAASSLVLTLKNLPAWYTSASEVIAEFSGWKINFKNRQQWRLPYGAQAQSDVKRLDKMLKQTTWQGQAWRINTRLGERWFFRPAKQGGLV